jgi:aryl-alcohol dehydrogenase-like predicted oxidoreductase
MNVRRLGKTGIEISPIGLGCWQFSQGKGLVGRMWATLDQATIDGVVAAALGAGVTWFDTAQSYGNGASERALSAALQSLDVEPGKVVVATKWFPVLKPAGNIPATIDTRIACLRPYPIDLFQVHLPWSVSSIAAQMREMATLVRGGKVRAIGVSNFSATQMARAEAALQAEGLPLAANQVRINMLDRRIERNGVLETARRLGVTLIAYSPLAQGVLTGRYHDDPAQVRSLPFGRRGRLSPAGWGLTPKGLARTAPLIDELRRVAETHGASAAQVALAWLVTHYGDTVVAIPGASRPEQSAAGAAAMDLRLTAAEMTRLDELSAQVAKR